MYAEQLKERIQFEQYLIRTIRIENSVDVDQPEVWLIQIENIRASRPVTINIYLQNNMSKINNLKVLNM